MSPSRTFILRPVATSLLMAALLLSGIVAYRQLPVSALPQVDYPTIQVVTFYPGASPDVMASSVTAPLERQLGQMPGLKQMTSTSSFGSSLVTLQFALELDIDVAEQEVQAAINAAGTYLPDDLPNPPIYSKTNPADAPVLTLALTSETLPLSKVQDLADTRLAQKISQLPGVGPLVRRQAAQDVLPGLVGDVLVEAEPALPLGQEGLPVGRGEVERDPGEDEDVPGLQPHAVPPRLLRPPGRTCGSGRPTSVRPAAGVGVPGHFDPCHASPLAFRGPGG